MLEEHPFGSSGGSSSNAPVFRLSNTRSAKLLENRLGGPLSVEKANLRRTNVYSGSGLLERRTGNTMHTIRG